MAKNTENTAPKKIADKDTVEAKEFIHVQTGNLKLEPGEKVVVDGKEKYVAEPTETAPANWKHL